MGDRTSEMEKGPFHLARKLLVDVGSKTRTRSSMMNDLSLAFESYHSFMASLEAISVVEAMSQAALSLEYVENMYDTTLSGKSEGSCHSSLSTSRGPLGLRPNSSSNGLNLPECK